MFVSDSEVEMARKEENEGATQSRVSVQLIDLDWIFESDNVENLLKVLLFEGQISVFKTKAIRSYVELLWKQYQPAIVQKIFYPYCVYMIVQMLLTSGFAGSFFKILMLPED